MWNAIIICIGAFFLGSCVMIHVGEEHGDAMGCLAGLATLGVMAVLWLTYPVAAVLLALIGGLWWRAGDAKLKR